MNNMDDLKFKSKMRYVRSMLRLLDGTQILTLKRTICGTLGRGVKRPESIGNKRAKGRVNKQYPLFIFYSGTVFWVCLLGCIILLS